MHWWSKTDIKSRIQSSFLWFKRKVGNIVVTLAYIFLGNPVVWCIYFVIAGVVIAGWCTEWQLTIHSTEIEIVDRTRDNQVTYILCKTVDGKEKIFKIESLYRRNMSPEKLADLYLKCKPGSKHEILYCTDDSSGNSYIIEIKE